MERNAVQGDNRELCIAARRFEKIYGSPFVSFSRSTFGSYPLACVLLYSARNEGTCSFAAVKTYRPYPHNPKFTTQKLNVVHHGRRSSNTGGSCPRRRFQREEERQQGKERKKGRNSNRGALRSYQTHPSCKFLENEIRKMTADAPGATISEKSLWQ